MFEINLIKERVVPISRKILRTFIVTAYYTLLLFATLVILIMSYSEESHIAQKLKDIRTLEEDFLKHKADQERYDENFAKGTRVYQENETLKAPWMNRINFAFLFDFLFAKWQDPALAKFASITRVEYDADFQVDVNNPESINSKYDKVFLYGKVWDDPKKPGINEKGYNIIQTYTDKQLAALKDALLADPNFTRLTNVANIEVESAPTGFSKDDKGDKNTCFFKITMSPSAPILPRPVVADKTASNAQPPK